ncbi:CPBP family intramembrane glutamic endopeptidase [Desulfogranum japonicum]|uniref:CPBP family intramembrane glutamic endopeptidase n=1 Tax=Desulfogranum japonicum TaxID=231447 RepID=UPI00041C9B36|nr:CPBP family intramembrane glutamic endopeptidase [Desulfogranum japonicum]
MTRHKIPSSQQDRRYTRKAANQARLRWLEFLLLFFLIPFIYAFHHEASPLYFLVILAFFSGIVLYRNHDFRNEVFTNKDPWLKDIRRVLLQFFLIALALTGLVYIFLPEQLFYFLRQHFSVWLSLMVIYPLLAVYPQELIYRAFLFHRYQRIAENEKYLLHFSAIAFSFGHIIYFHPISNLLTLAGGYLFSWTYLKTRSLLAVSFEHALYGCLMYTIGLGRYFYTGFDSLL